MSSSSSTKLGLGIHNPSASSSSSDKKTRKTVDRHLSYAPTGSHSQNNGAELAPSSASYHSSTRRHSLFGTEDRVVLDIGSRVSKFGFSGESKPRMIVRSVEVAQPCTSYLKVTEQSSLWDLDFERCPNQRIRQEKRALLLAMLTQLLRSAFSQYLLVDPKQRKVVVVENALMPTLVKEMICKVLFNNLQVPSVSFIPSSLLSIVAVGKITGLVVECGYQETCIVPVYYSRPMLSNLKTSPKAGKRLNQRLQALLLRFGKYIQAQPSFQGPPTPLNQRVGKIPAHLLTEDLLEEIKAKALFVGSYKEELCHDVTSDKPRPNQSYPLAAVSVNISHVASSPSLSSGLPVSLSSSSSANMPFVGNPSPHLESTNVTPDLAELQQRFLEYDEALDQDKMRWCKQRYSQCSSATSFTITVSGKTPDSFQSASTVQAINVPATASSLYSNSSSGIIAIPGWIRERAAEVLFEQGDQDELSLVELAVQVVSKLPVDLRKPMCENILVTGGTAMLPGLIHRFRVQLSRVMERMEQGNGCLSIERYKFEKKNPFKKRTKRCLHSNVSVLNDPWPDISSKSSRAKGGTSPCFSANLLAYIGGSLTGSLKTFSTSEITRETYHDAVKKLQAKEEQDETSSSNRGSFVGVVGGLETGAFGGLAAVSKHLSSSKSTKLVTSPSLPPL